MNLEQYIELIQKTTYAEISGMHIGSLTDAIIKFKLIPSIRQEMIPVFNRLSCVASVLEEKDGSFKSFIQQLSIPELVAAAEYALTMPPSALETLPIMEEIQGVYISASEEEIQTIEATMVSLQTLEIAIAKTAPAISALRAEEILQVLNDAKNQPITRPEPSQPQPRQQAQDQPMRQDAGKSKSEKLAEEISKDLVNILKYEKDAIETFNEIKKAPRKHPPTIYTFLTCHFNATCYLNVGERLSKCPTSFKADDVSADALRMRQFIGTYPDRAKKMRSICAELLKIKPELEQLISQVTRGCDKEYSLDDPYAAEFTLLTQEYDAIEKEEQYVEIYHRFKKLGENFPDAYLNAAGIVENACRSGKKGLRSLPKKSFFRTINRELECVKVLVQYFCVCCRNGGNDFDRCIGNLFYWQRNFFQFDYLHKMEEYFLSSGNPVCAQYAPAFIEQMELFGEITGSKARKSRRLANMIGKSSFAPPTTIQKRCSLILFPIFMAVFSFLFAFFAGPLQEPLTCGVLALVITLLISALQILALKFGAGHEKVFRITTPLMIIPAVAGHLFYRFVVAGATFGISVWPGSPETIFGSSFTIVLMAILPCCFLSRTTYAKLRYWLQSTIARRPIAGILFVFFFVAARSFSVQCHIGIIQSNFGWFGSLLAYVFSGALALLPLYITMNKRPYALFDKNKDLIFFIFAISTVIGVVFGLWSALPLMNVAEPPFTSELFFRMFNMQAFFFPVYVFFHLTDDKD